LLSSCLIVKHLRPVKILAYSVWRLSSIVLAARINRSSYNHLRSTHLFNRDKNTFLFRPIDAFVFQ